PSAATAQPVDNPPLHDSHRGIEPRTIALIAGGAVTAGLLTVAIVERVRGSNAEDDASQHRAEAAATLGHNCPVDSTLTACHSLTSALSDRNDANQISTWTFVGAGIAAAATATLYFMLPRARRVDADTVARISVVT